KRADRDPDLLENEAAPEHEQDQQYKAMSTAVRAILRCLRRSNGSVSAMNIGSDPNGLITRNSVTNSLRWSCHHMGPIPLARTTGATGVSDPFQGMPARS